MKIMQKGKIILIAGGILLVLSIASQVIGAVKYEMLVNVVEGKNVIGINPTTEKLDFGDLSRAGVMTRFITLKSDGENSAYILVWKFGEIAELVSLNKNYFILGPGEEERLSFKLQVPASAEVRKYEGGVWVFRLPKLF